MGDCGHVVSKWPSVSRFPNGAAEYICDTCTAAQYGAVLDGPSVWVYERTSPIQPPKPKKPRKATAPKVKEAKTIGNVRADGIW